MNWIAIGDVHGCAETLEALLDRLGPTSDDHLVFVGDYIDRGPDSKSVIERLLRLREEVTCTFLRGNHEALFLDYAERRDGELWMANGGVSTLRSYLDRGREVHIPAEHHQFFRDTELFFDTPDFFFVHAGLKPGRTVAEQIAEGHERTFLWERSHHEADELAWEKPVVCGHTPVSEPLDEPLLIDIDTGCVYHDRQRGMGRLTAVRLPEREFVSVRYRG